MVGLPWLGESVTTFHSAKGADLQTSPKSAKLEP
jgi:hypothetical protein